MKDEKDDYTISDYVYQNFGIQMRETWTCITCHAKKKLLKYDSFIIPLGKISHKEKKPTVQLVMRKILIWVRDV